MHRYKWTLWEDQNQAQIYGGSATPSVHFFLLQKRKKSNPFIAILPNCSHSSTYGNFPNNGKFTSNLTFSHTFQKYFNSPPLELIFGEIFCWGGGGNLGHYSKNIMNFFLNKTPIAQKMRNYLPLSLNCDDF